MVRLLCNSHCELAENPLWQAETNCFLWTDISAGQVHRLHVATGQHEIIYQGPPVGGFTLQRDGSLLLFRVNDIASWRDGVITVLRQFEDAGSERFNDVIADAEGRVYAGTIGCSDTSGGLFRVDRDLTITPLFRGTGVANGMAFSSDGASFYWTCSTQKQLRRYRYDQATGVLSDRQVIYQANDEEGTPDGLTIDHRGHLWSARWDGGAVVEHEGDGTVLARHPFPVRNVTSMCFGGVHLDRLYVTTAGGKPGATTHDGGIFEFTPGVSGPDQHRSAIGL